MENADCVIMKMQLKLSFLFRNLCKYLENPSRSSWQENERRGRKESEEISIYLCLTEEKKNYVFLKV